MPETPEPVVEALRIIERATAVDGDGGWEESGFGASVFDRIANVHSTARDVLASLTDEPRPTPVPQGLVERVRSATDKLDRYFRQEPHDRIGSGMGQEALRELRAALDTQQEADRD